ncbi:MAG: transketolase C-terminal domain-containing protein [Verrucomicrobiales bacterium]
MGRGLEDNKPFCGVGAQIASLISDKCFDDLDAPVQRMSAVDAPAIYSPPLEELQLPYPDQVIAMVLELV